MGEFSKNPSLNREHSFHGNVGCLVHILFWGAAVILLGFALKSYDDHGGWSVGYLLRFGLAVAVFGYYYRSVHKETAVFYALGLWEQSLLRRRSDDELIRAYSSGKRIIVDFREAEVFNGRFIPKPGGTTFQPPSESHDETGTTHIRDIQTDVKKDVPG